MFLVFLILDEPTNGLDPAGMRLIRNLFRTLCTEYGTTVMISTHILSEIEPIADTIGVINRGRLLQEMDLMFSYPISRRKILLS